MFKNTNSYGVQTQSMDQYGQGSPDFRYGHDILISVKKKKEKKNRLNFIRLIIKTYS